ncbi:14727_t:CDS:2 [Funneliformis caledonium]|uniref:14727_t:CDS:1 n=1 Tax=Funneliformis caledonium TaxID=1117310 RepID=A0A9N9FB26_9GLOM|nr:14727_t:CDS:2 [Funneliformis caledonium]
MLSIFSNITSSRTNFKLPLKHHTTLQLNSKLLILPNELLAEICENLSPQDLFSLSSVCKELRNILWSDKSIITQQIWRNSRHKFYPSLKSPPLIGMSEQQYLWLTVLAKKCQFCDESDVNLLKKYWEFQIICCETCLNKRMESHHTLLTKYNIPEDVLSTCLCLGDKGYLLSNIKTAQIEYSKAMDKDNWVTHKQLEVIAQKCRIISILLDEFHSDHKPMINFDFINENGSE